MPRKTAELNTPLHEVVRTAHNISDSTKDKYLRDLNQWVEFAGADPSNWTRKKAKAFYDKLLKRMRPQSATRLFASLTYASKWWSNLEERPELHFAVIQVIKGRKDPKPQRVLDEADAAKLLATCSGSSPRDLRDFAIIVIGLETGMRAMSIQGMDVENIEPEGSPKFPCPSALAPLKGKEPDWVPLSDAALTALAPWLSYLGVRGGPVFRGLGRRIGYAGKTEALPSADRISKSSITNLLAERSLQAGIPIVNPHMLRHTFVTWKTRAGLKPMEIGAITVHEIPEAGALVHYANRAAAGVAVRNSTPRWLMDLIIERSERLIRSGK